MERGVECSGEGWSWRLGHWLISAGPSPTDVPLAPARSKDDPMQLRGHAAGGLMCAVADLTLGSPRGGWAEGSCPCSYTALEPLTTTKVGREGIKESINQGRGRERGWGRGVEHRTLDVPAEVFRSMELEFVIVGGDLCARDRRPVHNPTRGIEAIRRPGRRVISPAVKRGLSCIANRRASGTRDPNTAHRCRRGSARPGSGLGKGGDG